MFASLVSTAGGSFDLLLSLLGTGIALVLGLVIALVYMSDGQYSKNFSISLVILPALIQIIITMVNGSLGTSVAVLGAFSLVRFRSVPGNSKDLCSIVFAMGVGLATGVGYISFAVIITALLSIVFFVLIKTGFGEKKTVEKELRITIPENLDYTEVFEDIFKRYTKSLTLNRVKTTNLGSMYEIQYSIILKKDMGEKQLIDELRCRNGNLPIICARPKLQKDEL